MAALQLRVHALHQLRVMDFKVHFRGPPLQGYRAAQKLFRDAAVGSAFVNEDAYLSYGPD
jgi:hypothetical protein